MLPRPGAPADARWIRAGVARHRLAENVSGLPVEHGQ